MKREMFPDEKSESLRVDFSMMMMNTEQMTDFYLHNIERTRRVRC